MAVLKSGNAVSAPLKPNETNNSASVKMVQTLLRDLGYYNGKIDGKYGKATIAAVKMFQKYNELPIDGKVGEDTLNRMKPPSRRPSTRRIPTPPKTSTSRSVSSTTATTPAKSTASMARAPLLR